MHKLGRTYSNTQKEDKNKNELKVVGVDLVKLKS